MANNANGNVDEESNRTGTAEERAKSQSRNCRAQDSPNNEDQKPIIDIIAERVYDENDDLKPENSKTQKSVKRRAKRKEKAQWSRTLIILKPPSHSQDTQELNSASESSEELEETQSSGVEGNERKREVGNEIWTRNPHENRPPSSDPPSQDTAERMVQDCESYVNWVTDPTLLLPHNLKRQIFLIRNHYVIPNETFDLDLLTKYNALEHMSNLGTLVFYHVECGHFREAGSIIERTREFVVPTLKGGHLPLEFLDSFNYVWFFLRLHASLQELQTTKKMKFFPQVDFTKVPKSFHLLEAKVRTGVLGLKFYFFRLQKAPYDQQIDILQEAISVNFSYYEWHYLLFKTLRDRRKEHSSHGLLHLATPRDEEVREINWATKLAPNNPRCILASIQFLADFVKLILKENKPINFKLGENKFQSIINVKSHIQEQTS